nr:MAG TPA: hypothetical protein [Caudoviricetes sp.]
MFSLILNHFPHDNYYYKYCYVHGTILQSNLPLVIRNLSASDQLRKGLITFP